MSTMVPSGLDRARQQLEKRWHQRQYHRLPPLLLLICASLLVLTAVVPLGANLGYEGPPQGAELGELIAIRDDQEPECIFTYSSYPEGSADRCALRAAAVPSDAESTALPAATNASWDMCLVLTIQRLDPARGFMVANLSLQAPEGFRRRLSDSAGTPVFTYDDAAGGFVLDPKHAKSVIRLRLVEPTGRASVATPVRLDDLFPSDALSPAGLLIERIAGPCRTNHRADVPLELPLVSRPQTYPNDWYALDVMIEVVLPPELALGVDADDFGTMVPFTLFVEAGTELTHTSLGISHDTVDVPYLSRMYPISFARVLVLVTRDTNTQLFVYGVSLLPLALFFVLLTLLRTQRSDQLWDVLLGIGAGFLAVLPLRQVLVPSEVPGLTRVDFILGAELTLMVALFLLLRAHSWDHGAVLETTSTYGSSATPLAVNPQPLQDRDANTSHPAKDDRAN